MTLRVHRNLSFPVHTVLQWSAYSSKPGVKLEFLRFRNANYIQENSGTHNAATSHSVYGYIRVFPLPCSGSTTMIGPQCELRITMNHVTQMITGVGYDQGYNRLKPRHIFLTFDRAKWSKVLSE